jgi:hypothetical protein
VIVYVVSHISYTSSLISICYDEEGMSSMTFV